MVRSLSGPRSHRDFCPCWGDLGLIGARVAQAAHVMFCRHVCGRPLRTCCMESPLEELQTVRTFSDRVTCPDGVRTLQRSLDLQNMEIRHFLHRIREKISWTFITTTLEDCSKGDIQDHFLANQSFGIISKSSSQSFLLIRNSKASSQRLERVSKGHKLWNILDEIDGDHQFQEVVTPDVGRQKRNAPTHVNDLGASYLPKEPLHGLNVDLKVYNAKSAPHPSSGRLPHALRNECRSSKQSRRSALCEPASRGDVQDRRPT
jgi:hypothetical protein